MPTEDELITLQNVYPERTDPNALIDTNKPSFVIGLQIKPRGTATAPIVNEHNVIATNITLPGLRDVGLHVGLVFPSAPAGTREQSTNTTGLGNDLSDRSVSSANCEHPGTRSCPCATDGTNMTWLTGAFLSAFLSFFFPIQRTRRSVQERSAVYI
jgi:hypothetical protein